MRQLIRAWLVPLIVLAMAIGSASHAEAQKGKRKRPAASAKKSAKDKAPKDKPAPEDAPADEGEPTSTAPAGAGSEDSRALKRGERIEFDARLIQGQTAKAGAVYLFERASSNLRSMVKDRVSFRDRIVRTVFPEGKGQAVKDQTKEEIEP